MAGLTDRHRARHALIWGLLLAITAMGFAAPAQAMSRRQATAIALAVLHPEKSRFEVTVFALRREVPAGTTLSDDGPGPAAGSTARSARRGLDTVVVTQTVLRPLPRRAWVFWEDLAPYARFAHGSVILAVDDSGRVLRRQALNWYPLIDGKVAAFLAGPDAYDSTRYRVYTSPGLPRPVPAGRTGDRAVAASPVVGPVVGSVVGPPKLAHDCVFEMADHVDPNFSGDLTIIHQVMGELGLPPQVASSGFDLNGKVSRAERDKRCHDALIVIVGHGFARRGANIPHPSGTGTVAESRFAQVTIKTTVVDRAGTQRVVQTTIDSRAVRAVMRNHPGMKFKLIVDACFSGRWAELSDEPQLQVLETASRADQMSIGYYPDGQYAPEQQRNGVFYAVAPGVTLDNHTLNTTHSGGGTNGFMRALDLWAHSAELRARTGDDLAKGIAIAFNSSHQYNFSELKGATQTQLSDHTGVTAMPGPAPPTPGGGTPGAPGPGGSPAGAGGGPPGPGGGTSANQPPVAKFDLPGYNPPSSPKAGQPVTFDGSASTDPDGTVAVWDWNWGDGSGSTGQTKTHVFAAPGVYTVTLDVYDNLGAHDSTSHKVYVSGAGTKAAALTDVPCDQAVTGGYVDINVPSFAQASSAALTAQLAGCAGRAIDPKSVKFTLVSGPAPGSTPEMSYDEWGQPKNHLHVEYTFNPPGSAGAGTGSATFTASWS